MTRLVTLLLLLVFLFSACTNEEAEKIYTSQISDSLNLFSQAQVDSFKLTQFPKGVMPVLISIDSLDELSPGTTADNLFDEYYKDQDSLELFEEMGLMLVVSRNPQLIQLRAGNSLRNHLRWKGISAGEAYLKLQKAALNDSIDYALDSMFLILEKRLPEITNISWWDKIQYNQAAAIIGDEVEEFGLPTESFYSDTFLKPTLKLRVWELNKTGTWWITYLLVALAIFLLTKTIERIVKLITEKFMNKSFQSLTAALISFLLGIYLSIPALSSATILSSGRMEDILALQASGIPFTDYFSVGSAAYGLAAPLWLIAILAVARILKGMAPYPELLTMVNLPNQMQQKIFLNFEQSNKFGAEIIRAMATKGSYQEDVISEKEFMEKPYQHAYFNQFNKEGTKAGLWAFLAFSFLSKAIVLAAIFLWIFPILEGYYNHIKVIRAFNKRFSDYAFSIKTLFLVPLAFFVLFWGISVFKQFFSYILLAISILFSSGILLSTLVNELLAELNTWQSIALSLSIPVYYFLRMAIAMFQYENQLITQFKQYLTVTLVSFVILIVIYFGLPEYNIQKSIVSLFPKTEMILTQHTIKEEKPPLGVITGTGVNMRKGANTQTEILFKITAKDTFLILQNDSLWWKIRFREKEGYLFGKYAKPLEDNNQQAN